MRAAAIQVCSKNDVQENLERIEAQVDKAVQQGARLIALPENFAFMGDERSKVAEMLGEGPISRWCEALAKLHDVHVVASGMPEKSPDGRAFNTSVYYAHSLKAAYRKIHMFDVDLADGTSLKESKHCAPGDKAVTAETPWGRMGLSICYDVRFPELFRSVQADFWVLGAAFTLHTGRDHWLTLLKARAIENQCAFICPAQWGRHSDKRVSYGRSCIIDAWGNILSLAPDKDGFAIADIDFDDQKRIRAELPALAHRRL